MTGLTLGKYLPFHRGHEALIRFALSHCERLIVLVCASDQERISGERRAGWIRDTFADSSNLEVRVLPYQEDQFPNTSESSREVSAIWLPLLQQVAPETELLFSSEPYGDYLAELWGIRHQAFDQARDTVPISATQIRANPLAHWAYLPLAVRKDCCQKIVVLGTESTGKTTLSQDLATHYGVPWVAEAGRELIPDSRDFERNDLYLVATTHAQAIETALNTGPPLLLIDTDVHITQSYAQHFFGAELTLEKELYTINQADLSLYLAADVPWVQDGTRLEVEARNALDQSHRATLARFGVPFVEIGGNWAERTAQAIAHIDRLITKGFGLN